MFHLFNDVSEDEHVLLRLSDLSPTEIKNRLQNYTKFIFVRNPHERLLSAYQNKFVQHHRATRLIQEHYVPKIRAETIKRLKRKNMNHALNQTGLFNRTKKVSDLQISTVSFQEFIRYIGDTKNKLAGPFEAHWREMYRLCSPCTIHYDFIGNLETLKNDAYYILKNIGARHLFESFTNFNFPGHATNSSNPHNVREAFANVTEEDILQFERRFEKDMKMFGYQRPLAITHFKPED